MATDKEAKPEAPKGPSAGTSSLAEDFVPNEPTHKSGTDAEGKPDGTLGASQVERAAAEALLSLRPQPAASEIHKVLETLAETDPKTSQPKHKFKTAADAGNAAVAELNKAG